jgi:cell division protein FtsQ
MVRDNPPRTPADEPGGPPAELDDFDGRMLELEPDEESPFLRGQKRVPVRRGPLPRKAAHRLKYALLALLVVGVLAAIAGFTYRYGAHSWRFRLDSSDQVEIAGLEHVTRVQVMEVLGADIGRNVFFIPLAERKRQLEEIPWVESAAVMRLLPNRLKVQVRERTPVAFVQIGSRIALIDRSGVVMDLPAGSAKQYSFPVIVGTGDQEPLSTRAARMKIYDTLIRELDSEGARYSQDISEVDLADPEDVKITVANAGSEVLVHLGSGHFLERYKVFVANVQDWRQKYQQLESVDLRYDQQVVLNPDSAARAAPAAAPPQPAPTEPAPKSATPKPPPRPKRSR